MSRLPPISTPTYSLFPFPTLFRSSVTVLLDPAVLKAARGNAKIVNRTLTNYIETLMRRDLQMGSAEPVIEVIASADIRNSAAVPIPDENEEERKRRDEVFFAVLEAGGY